MLASLLMFLLRGYMRHALRNWQITVISWDEERQAVQQAEEHLQATNEAVAQAERWLEVCEVRHGGN